MMEWGKIFSVFEDSLGHDADLMAFIEESAGPVEDVLSKIENTEKASFLSDAVADIWRAIAVTAFDIGYTLGESVDVSDPKAREYMASIKQLIGEKGLLPCLPRERRAQ